MNVFLCRCSQDRLAEDFTAEMAEVVTSHMVSCRFAMKTLASVLTANCKLDIADDRLRTAALNRIGQDQAEAIGIIFYLVAKSAAGNNPSNSAAHDQLYGVLPHFHADGNLVVKTEHRGPPSTFCGSDEMLKLLHEAVVSAARMFPVAQPVTSSLSGAAAGTSTSSPTGSTTAASQVRARLRGMYPPKALLGAVATLQRHCGLTNHRLAPLAPLAPAVP